MRGNKSLRFTDRRPIGLLGGVLFISAATFMLAAIWGLGTQPNLSLGGKTFLWAIRLIFSAFLMIFYYGGLEMLFGSFSVQIDSAANVIRYRERPPPISKRTVIPFAAVKSVLVEPRPLRRVFAGSSSGFGVFILAQTKLFIFETEDQNEALAIATRVAAALGTPIQNNFPSS